jgi:hypothetical protein
VVVSAGFFSFGFAGPTSTIFGSARYDEYHVSS